MRAWRNCSVELLDGTLCDGSQQGVVLELARWLGGSTVSDGDDCIPGDLSATKLVVVRFSFANFDDAADGHAVSLRIGSFAQSVHGPANIQ